ncbi:MAG: CoA ester lyase [Rhizobiaceae bacterium]|nr:CoA ester lyase [Rhizobiaceae bacterium]
MRSLLFVPGDSERKLEKAFSSAADVVIVDLEDSVALDGKARARQIAGEFLLARGTVPGPKVYVRINELASGMSEADLGAMLPAAPAGVMLPKAGGGADVERLSAMLRVQEAIAGRPDCATAIIPIITETGVGVFSAGTYAGSSTRLAGLTWGAEDLSAAIGARSTRDDSGLFTDVFRLARALTLLGASAADTAAIDTVYPNFRDAAGFAAECRDAERDGFVAKMAIHPDQVPVINAAFTPSAEAVQEARSVVDAFTAAGNAGVINLDGRMFDRPHLRRAQRLLARAGKAG